MHVAVAVDRYSYRYPDSAKVATLLSAGADVHARDVNGDTPLHLAVNAGLHTCCRKVLDLLLAAGADVNARNSSGIAPIHLSLNHWPYPVDFLARMLVAGADVNASDDRGRTPLDFAVKARGPNESAARVATLLQHGAAPNSRDVAGRSPLHWAARLARHGAARALISGHASALLPDVEGRTALHALCAAGFRDLVERVVMTENVDRELRDSNGWTPLHDAVWAWKDDLARWLIRERIFEADSRVMAGLGDWAGLDDFTARSTDRWDARDIQGRTALHWAARRNQVDIAARLLSVGASINLQDQNGMSPLHLALVLNGRSVSRLLIARGASIDLVANDGRSVRDLLRAGTRRAKKFLRPSSPPQNPSAN